MKTNKSIAVAHEQGRPLHALTRHLLRSHEHLMITDMQCVQRNPRNPKTNKETNTACLLTAFRQLVSFISNRKHPLFHTGDTNSTYIS